MGEAQTHHFDDFCIFEPVTKPHNQHYLSLEAPGHLNKIKTNPWNIKQHILCLANVGTNIFIFLKVRCTVFIIRNVEYLIFYIIFY